MSKSSGAESVSATADSNLSLRKCLGHFATGVAVVSYPSEEGPRGLTVNSFTSVSLDPPLVLVCLDKSSKAVAYLPWSSFAINVLHANQKDLVWHFAGRPSFLQPSWRCVGAVPLLSDSLAWLVCERWSNQDAGDHIIVVGRVVEFGARDEKPLCFFRGELMGLSA